MTPLPIVGVVNWNATSSSPRSKPEPFAPSLSAPHPQSPIALSYSSSTLQISLSINPKQTKFRSDLRIKAKTTVSIAAVFMGRLYIETLSGPKIFKCRCCKVDSASHDDIVSKDFQGRYGRAYLFRNVVNISLGPKEHRLLLSGLHTVNDIYCSSCQQILGWRYEKAYEESQKFKEGLYILEKERMLKDGW